MILFISCPSYRNGHLLIYIYHILKKGYAMKKSALLLLCALLIPMAVACSSGSGDTAADTSSAETTTAETTAEVTSEEKVTDDLPALDFKGYEFKVHTRSAPTMFTNTDPADQVGLLPVSNGWNQLPITAVIARSEATWQSPGTTCEFVRRTRRSPRPDGLAMTAEERHMIQKTDPPESRSATVNCQLSTVNY